jgi:hypothetical protein
LWGKKKIEKNEKDLNECLGRMLEREEEDIGWL